MIAGKYSILHLFVAIVAFVAFVAFVTFVTKPKSYFSINYNKFFGMSFEMTNFCVPLHMKGLVMPFRYYDMITLND